MKLLRVLLLFAIFSPSAAFACSCMGGTPLCQSFWGTDSVFVGTVIGIDHTTRDIGVGFPVSRLIVRFQVSKGYRGNIGQEAIVETGAGGGDCGYHFESGHTYLVFGSVRNGSIYTGICTPTQPVEQAGPAIAWLDSVSTLPQTGAIYGKITQQVVKEDRYRADPIPGVPVHLTDSAGSVSAATTDAGGAYSFTGLASGKYSLDADLPESFFGDHQQADVALHAQGCADVSFHWKNNGRISGRVLDSKGRPAKGITVAVFFLQDPHRGNYVKGYVPANDFQITDESGRYHFKGLLPGTYLVFVNPFAAQQQNAPYPRQFYPGVAGPEKATRLEIKASEELLDIDFALPQPQLSGPH
jgi:hypothetical protein